MKQFNKKLILVMLLIGIFLLTGCSNASDKDVTVVTIVPEDTTDKSSDNNTSEDKVSPKAQSESEDTSPTQVAQPLADIELPIYTVNAEGNIEPVIALLPEGSEKTPEIVVEKVVESLADQSILIECSVTFEKDSVIISFDQDKAPYSNMGSEYEANILNAFAQSLLDNLEAVKKVYFQIEGKSYSGGALEYDIDEAYTIQ